MTQVFRLNYASAASIVQVLRPLIAPNNPITAYPANNTIVVTDFAENVRRIGRIIAAIDTPAGSEIDIVRLQHAIASDLAVLFGKMLEAAAQGVDASQRVTVLAEPSSNSLLIRAASPARATLVRTLIAKLDQPSATPGNIHVVYLKNAEATRLARTLLGVGGSDPGAGGLSAVYHPFGISSGGPACGLASADATYRRRPDGSDRNRGAGIGAGRRRADPGRPDDQYPHHHRAGGGLSPVARRHRQARRAPRAGLHRKPDRGGDG